MWIWDRYYRIISEIVTLVPWRRRHLPSVHWNNSVRHCSLSHVEVSGLFHHNSFYLFLWSEAVVREKIEPWPTKRGDLRTRIWNCVVWRGSASHASPWPGEAAGVLLVSAYPSTWNWPCSSSVSLCKMPVQLWSDEFYLKCVHVVPYSISEPHLTGLQSHQF